MRRKRILAGIFAVMLVVSTLAMSAMAAEKKPYIKQVEAGAYSLAVTSNGDLYGWGANTFGLIDPSKVESNGQYWDNVLIPVKLMSDVKTVAVPADRSICNARSTLSNHAASVTGNFIMIVKTDGKLYVKGDNSTGQHGSGKQYGYQEDRNFTKWDTTSMHYVMDDVKEVSCNGSACAAITNDGDLYFWGYNFADSVYGGQPINYWADLEPRKILSDVKAVELGYDHIVALKEDGTVWTMGCQDDGTLGNGADIAGSDSLLKEMTQAFTDCVDIAAGAHTTYMVRSNGDLYVCGNNTHAKLGFTYDNERFLTPTKVKSNVVLVDAAADNACYIKADGSLWSMGDNSWYQRGYYLKSGGWIGEHTQVTTDAKSVSVGGRYTLLLKTDDTMYGFGDSNYLGTGTADYPNPLGDKYGDTPYVWAPVAAGISSGIYAGMFGSSFKDVKSSAYYYEPVLWAVEQGITSGTSDTTFSPDQTCSRAQIITFLWRAAGCPAPKSSSHFTDVSSSDYYAQAANWAAEQGMVSGDCFDPNAPCTRLMAVDFMWKASGSPIASNVDFTDIDSLAVNWAVKQGVTNGTSATTFSPNQTCTRGQIVTFLYRAEQ